MNGNVFTAFADLVEESFGLGVWHKVLDDVGTESDGVYIGAANYPDGELLALVASLSKHTGVPVDDLVFSFGENLFENLAEIYPDARKFNSLRELVNSIESVIHFEVNKLYESVSLPTFDCEDMEDGRLAVYYFSKRKLCKLAEGLIAGAAKEYNTKYELDHDRCMHRGDERCRFIMTFGA